MLSENKIFLSLYFLLSVFFSNAQKLSDWMSETLDSSASLRTITVPGAHDASVYRCFECTIGANTKNTQTQYLPVESLLDSGIRYFDLRPVLDDGRFYTGHYTQYDQRPSFGCKGDTLERILNCVNKFLNDHNELVILHFSHYCNREWRTDSLYIEKLLLLLERTLSDIIYIPGSDERLADTKYFQFISNKKGKAILLFNDLTGNSALRKRGFFSDCQDILLFDRYSNTTDVNFMWQDQKQKFTKWKSKNRKEREELFVMPWTLTHNTKAAIRCSGIKWPWQRKISIIDYAQQAKKLLFPLVNEWIAEGIFTSEIKPNIINVDIADGDVTRLCIQLNKLQKNEQKE